MYTKAPEANPPPASNLLSACTQALSLDQSCVAVETCPEAQATDIILTAEEALNSCKTTGQSSMIFALNPLYVL